MDEPLPPPPSDDISRKPIGEMNREELLKEATRQQAEHDREEAEIRRLGIGDLTDVDKQVFLKGILRKREMSGSYVGGILVRVMMLAVNSNTMVRIKKAIVYNNEAVVNNSSRRMIHRQKNWKRKNQVLNQNRSYRKYPYQKH